MVQEKWERMKVSVVIPCFNGEQFIEEAIASVLGQTHQDVECIVVDDASKDRSREIIQRLAAADARIQPVLLDENGGPSAARNKAMAMASGEWVTFLDADDLYDPRRIEKLVAAVSGSDANAAVDNQSVRRYPDGPHEFSGFRFLTPGKVEPFTAETFFAEEGKIDRYLRPGYMKAMIKRDWLHQQGVGFPLDMRVSEDFIFYATLFAKGMKCLGVGHDGYIYRRRPASLSQSQAVNFKSMSDAIGRFLSEYRGMVSEKSVAALTYRSTMLRRLSSFGGIEIALRQRNFAKAVRLILQSPESLLVVPPLAKRKLERLLQKGTRS